MAPGLPAGELWLGRTTANRAMLFLGREFCFVQSYRSPRRHVDAGSLAEIFVGRNAVQMLPRLGAHPQ